MTRKVKIILIVISSFLIVSLGTVYALYSFGVFGGQEPNNNPTTTIWTIHLNWEDGVSEDYTYDAVT